MNDTALIRHCNTQRAASDAGANTLYHEKGSFAVIPHNKFESVWFGSREEAQQIIMRSLIITQRPLGVPREHWCHNEKFMQSFLLLQFSEGMTPVFFDATARIFYVPGSTIMLQHDDATDTAAPIVPWRPVHHQLARLYMRVWCSVPQLVADYHQRMRVYKAAHSLVDLSREAYVKEEEKK